MLQNLLVSMPESIYSIFSFVSATFLNNGSCSDRLSVPDWFHLSYNVYELFGRKVNRNVNPPLVELWCDWKGYCNFR